MSLRFKGTDLRPVLTEAIANQCRVMLIKDHGVYFMAERGERQVDNRRALLAYAIGCNPDTDPFDTWWNRADDELGGDDFGEYFDPKEPVFSRILSSQDDLLVLADPETLSLEAVSPVQSGS